MPDFQTNLAWDTLLDLEASGPGPLHARLTRALRAAIRDGRLAPGAALPPSRALAESLRASRWVVTEAYEQLVAEGYLEARVGSATRVRAREEARPSPAAAHDDRQARPAIDLAPGLPDLRAFPSARWLATLRSIAGSLPYTEFGYGDPAGHPRLRSVLGEYLARIRGAVVDVEHVTVTSGTTNSVARLCRSLAAAGISAIGVEDPGWQRLRAAAGGAGLDVVPIPVDGHGLRVDALEAEAHVRALVVSPAHQFPTGTVLAPERRAALLDWARRVDGLILEDDYDAEFRYDRRPVGTLQGTEPARVALLGSLSKTLAPSLAIGWVVTPERWTAPLRAVEMGVATPPTLDQLAFAAFVADGSYDRHLRASRNRYRARRDRLVAALARALPRSSISGVAAGLHLLVHFEPPFDARGVVRAAAARGVETASLDQYLVRNEAWGPGLVLGYGDLGDGDVERAVAALAAAVEEVRRSAAAIDRPSMAAGRGG